MRQLHVLYDDTIPVSEDVKGSIGIDRFGAVFFKRQTLEEAMEKAVAAAGLPPMIVLREPADWALLDERLQRDEIRGTFLVCPSNVCPTLPAEAVGVFLKQICHAPNDLLLPLQGSSRIGWTLMSDELLRPYVKRQMDGDRDGFYETRRRDFSMVEGRLGLVDIAEERALLDFLSGTFDVRHFNAIVREGYTITKRSQDGAKLKREYDLYDLLPPRMQSFFLRPFDFKSDGGVAEYRMERLFVPDMAVQWLQGGFEAPDFERFIDYLFHFITGREARPVARDVAVKTQEALYVAKVRERIADLKTMDDYAKLAPLMEAGFGGIDLLLARYIAMFEKWRRFYPLDRLVIGHGDLCFSNILYSKTNQFMRLIDARGASSVDDLFTDPYYDLAKLSHSVLGNYDAINQDMFDISVDKDLHLAIVLDRGTKPWARDIFLDRLTGAGFDPKLTRLAEASLFVSMLPLHMDRPRKVLAFAVNASKILDELEA